jgi:hypothetical protein
MEDRQEKARPGRREKEGGRPKSGVMTFRVRQGMRDRLQASAEARGMSISEEVERRLDLSLDMALDPFKLIALRMIVEKWKMIDALVAEGCSIEDPMIYARKAFEAVEDALRAADDPGWTRGQSGERVKDFYGRLVERGVMRNLAARNGHNLEASVADAADGAVQNEIFEGVMDEPVSPKKTKAERDAEAAQAAKRKEAAAEAGFVLTASPNDNPELASRPATPDEIAAATPARGLLSPEIGDRALFDEVMGPARTETHTPAEPPAPTKPRSRKVKAPA